MLSFKSLEMIFNTRNYRTRSDPGRACHFFETGNVAMLFTPSEGRGSFSSSLLIKNSGSSEAGQRATWFTISATSQYLVVSYVIQLEA